MASNPSFRRSVDTQRKVNEVRNAVKMMDERIEKISQDIQNHSTGMNSTNAKLYKLQNEHMRLDHIVTIMTHK